MSWPQFDEQKMAAFWAVRCPLLPSTEDGEETTLEEVIGRIREAEVQERERAN